MEPDPLILRVAVFPPAPPDCIFDYLLPPGTGRVAPGCRVRIPFGPHSRVGVVIETATDSSVDESKLRPAEALLDEHPALPDDLIRLLRWTAHYYQYPLGRVLSHTVPRLVRRGEPLSVGAVSVWEADGGGEVLASLSRAPAQRQLFALLQVQGPLDAEALDRCLAGWRQAARALIAKGNVVKRERALPEKPPAPFTHELSGEQSRVLAAISASTRFERHLVEGVTGSGKTEIYLRAAEKVLRSGGQILVMVPEIGLTSQTVAYFQEHFGTAVAMFHSGMSERSRFHAWSRAHMGTAKIIIGTRSSMFVPCKSLAMIVVDEEHDVSYKQQDSLRYHARDLAIKRAKLLDIPIVLGSATPSLESLHNVANKQYRHHLLKQRVGSVGMPSVKVIDLRRRRLVGGVCDALLEEIEKHVARDKQVLLFLNRRGYAPQLVCHDCGEVVMCPDCDAPLVYHLSNDAMRCHHCGHASRRPDRCLRCESLDLKNTGMGTERIEQDLLEVFPRIDITRIDADSVGRKGELERNLEKIHGTGARILIGTQMLSKGHHFPRVTLVGILNVDQRLFAPDFRSLERLGQLIVQVSGRAGRGSAPGEVCLQTYYPEHPHLQCLLHNGYAGFARQLLLERKKAMLPPYFFMALIRASADVPDIAMDFLATTKSRLRSSAGRHRISMLGPAPMMSEKREGRYRSQLLLRAMSRSALTRCLSEALPLIHAIRKLRGVTWYVDVDPVEIEY